MVSFMRIIDFMVLGVFTVGLLSGFFANLLFWITLKDPNYIEKAFINLGEAFLSPQREISQIVASPNPEFATIQAISVVAYSGITLFYIWLIWKFVNFIVGTAMKEMNPFIYFINFIVTIVIFAILLNVASYFTGGGLILNPFSGWTDLIYNPAPLLNFVKSEGYIPLGDSGESSFAIKEGFTNKICPSNCLDYNSTHCKC